jgi:hypothetical protein
MPTEASSIKNPIWAIIEFEQQHRYQHIWWCRPPAINSKNLWAITW